jgi:hypothetical protein
MGDPGLVLTFDYGSFSSSCRVVWLTVFFPRGFGHVRLIHSPCPEVVVSQSAGRIFQQPARKMGGPLDPL